MGVASYIVLHPEGFELSSKNPKKTLSFTLPRNVVVGDEQCAPIFSMDVESKGDVQVKISLDGQSSIEESVPDGVETRVHEIIDPAELGPGDHSIIVERTGGSGTLMLDDVVLWYHVTT